MGEGCQTTSKIEKGAGRGYNLQAVQVRRGGGGSAAGPPGPSAGSAATFRASGRLGRADGWSELADAMALPHLLPTPLRLRKPGSIVGLESRFVGVLAACADAALRPGSQLRRQRRHLERRGGLARHARSPQLRFSRADAEKRVLQTRADPLPAGTDFRTYLLRSIGSCEGVNNVFTARPQVKTLTCGLVESAIVLISQRNSHLLLIELVVGKRGYIWAI